MIGPVLRGKRVTLRPARMSDAGRLFRWRNGEVVRPFVMLGSASIEEERRRIKLTRELSDRVLYIIKTKQGKAIGAVSLGDVGGRNMRVGIGIMIGEDGEHGKGYGKESMKLLIAYAFRHLKIHKIWLEVFSSNVRAIHLYKNLGFKKEGVLREHILKNGTFVDQLRMGLLDREWKAMQKARKM